VGVLQPGSELDLALEPVAIDSGRHVGGKHLDHHPPAEGRLLRQEYAAHPATAQLSLDAVGGTDCRLESLYQFGHVRPVTDC
jgi:hypothetical protein